MVEGARLLSECTPKRCTEGSNPSLSVLPDVYCKSIKVFHTSPRVGFYIFFYFLRPKRPQFLNFVDFICDVKHNTGYQYFKSFP